LHDFKLQVLLKSFSIELTMRDKEIKSQLIQVLKKGFKALAEDLTDQILSSYARIKR